MKSLELYKILSGIASSAMRSGEYSPDEVLNATVALVGTLVAAAGPESRYTQEQLLEIIQLRIAESVTAVQRETT